MPDLTNMQTMQTASNFHFQAVGLDALGATEYTLATVVVDISGSVSGWERQLEDCLKAAELKRTLNTPLALFIPESCHLSRKTTIQYKS